MTYNTVEYKKTYDEKSICTLIEDFSYKLGIMLTDAKYIINFDTIIKTLEDKTDTTSSNSIMRMAMDGIIYSMKEYTNSLSNRDIDEPEDAEMILTNSKSASNSPLIETIANKDNSRYTDPDKFDGEVNAVSNILENEDRNYIPSKIGRFAISKERLYPSLHRKYQLESCILDALNNILESLKTDNDCELKLAGRLTKPEVLHNDAVELNTSIQHKIDINWGKRSIASSERADCDIYDRTYIFSRILNISIILYTVDNEEYIIRKDIFEPKSSKILFPIYLYYNPHSKVANMIKWIRSSKGKNEPPVEEKCRIGWYPRFGLAGLIPWDYDTKDIERINELVIPSNSNKKSNYKASPINIMKKDVAEFFKDGDQLCLSAKDDEEDTMCDVDDTTEQEPLEEDTMCDVDDTIEQEPLEETYTSPEDNNIPIKEVEKMDISDNLTETNPKDFNINTSSRKRRSDQINQPTEEDWVKIIALTQGDVIRFKSTRIQCHKIFIERCTNPKCAHWHLSKEYLCPHKKSIRITRNKNDIKEFEIIGCEHPKCKLPYKSLCMHGKYCRNSNCADKKIHNMSDYIFEKTKYCTYSQCKGVGHCDKCKSDFVDSKRIFEIKYC
jgi:hypothetical protein